MKGEKVQKGKWYLVKVIAKDDKRLINRELKVVWTGILLRGVRPGNYLLLYEVEILRELEKDEIPDYFDNHHLRRLLGEL